MKRTRERCTQGQNEWAGEGADRIGRRMLREKKERGNISEMLHRFEEGGDKGLPELGAPSSQQVFFSLREGIG